MSDPGRCLTASDVVAYVNGETAAARRAEVERHLDECRLCQEAVAGVADLEWREGFLESADTILARVRSRTARAATADPAARRTAPRFRPAPRYLTLAATVALAVGGAAYLTRPGPAERLFERHFEPYPSAREVVRGAAGNDRASALSQYEARDFQGALAALEKDLVRDPKDPVTLFYAGVSRLALGRGPEAIPDLQEVVQRSQSDLAVPAEWYLALAQLRSQDFAAARSTLERIGRGEGFYRDRARALLADVERLERGN